MRRPMTIAALLLGLAPVLASSAQATGAIPADAASSASAPDTSMTEATPPVTAPSPATAAPKKLAVGTGGVFQPSLLLQDWFTAGWNDPTTTTFRLRRAEIHVKGEIVPHEIAYEIAIDPAKVLEFRNATVAVAPPDTANPEQVTVSQPASAVSALQDFFITYLSRYADVSFGQFKIPVSWEGYNSASKLLFPERDIVSREWGDKRDIGVRVAKTFARAGYSAGLFDGAGQNVLDTNNAKDAALRVEVYPTSGALLAGVIYGSIGERDTPTTKDRYEADLRLERGRGLVQAEYVRAHDVGASGAGVDAQGFYVAAGWTIGRIQPIARAGYLDPDVDRDADPAATGGRDEVKHWDAGVNVYLRRHEAKIQASISRLDYDDKPDRTEMIVAHQVSF